MKKIISLILLAALSSCIGAGENSKIVANEPNFFPQIVGIDLEGAKHQLPNSFNKKLNIVVVAFKREQQEQVNSWIKVADKITAKNPNVDFFEVPLIYELNMFSRSFINNGMRRGIPDAKARKRTITVYTNRDEFFKVMKMQEDQIYTLLLNKNGKILWRTQGVADNKKIKALNSAIKKIKK
jgi:hypothetical protein